MKVFVGLSGGVDSAVSAALLQQQGYEVVGAFIRIALPGYPCSAGEDKVSAQRVAAHLKIPFVEVNLSKEYEQEVFKKTVAEFARGRTPNPDTLCNREIKFGIFYDWCMAQGADLVATGHYAQLSPAKPAQKKVLGSPHSVRPDYFSEQVLLYAGADENKDQSYFLYMVPQEKLRKTLFPIGHLHKPEVRKLASKFGLPNAERKDSQGLCFLGDVSIDDMLHRELTLVPGDILNTAGEVIGTHEGVQAYTLGQRHGFVIQAHEPHFVIAKDITANTITVSPNRFPAHATQTELTLTQPNWIGPVQEGEYAARYRYRQELIPATLDVQNNTVTLNAPHYAPLGQSVVLYNGSRCLGGGIIDEACLSS